MDRLSSSDKWPGQNKSSPIGSPPKGFWYDPEIKEGAPTKGVSLNDAVKHFISNPTLIGKPSHINMAERSVELDNGKSLSFDDIIKAYQEVLTKKSDYSFFESPTDLGKKPKGDFPSVTWVPNGTEDKEVDEDRITAKAFEHQLPLDHEKQITAKWGPEYISALYHLNQAIKNGHPKDRAVQYAVAEMKKMGVTISPMTLLEIADIYMGSV